ncbi:MAG: acetolactate synthase small subunit [Cytophagales bacterium]|nr:MAG: acetolactate synthase small subunit [Cytophagales bacterium]
MEYSKKLSIKFINRQGNIIRVALVLERRGYSIKSLNIYALNDDSGYSEMHLEIRGEETRLEQIKKQLSKLIDIIEVKDLAKAEDVVPSVAFAKN